MILRPARAQTIPRLRVNSVGGGWFRPPFNPVVRIAMRPTGTKTSPHLRDFVAAGWFVPALNHMVRARGQKPAPAYSDSPEGAQ